MNDDLIQKIILGIIGASLGGFAMTLINKLNRIIKLLERR